MFARRDPAHMFERAHDADRSMATHPEIPDVVEEDHTCRVSTVDRFTQKCADHSVMTSRFANDRGAQIIVVATEALHAFLHRSGAEIRKTGDHYPRRFASGMRVDCLDPILNGHSDETEVEYNAFEGTTRNSAAYGSLTI